MPRPIKVKKQAKETFTIWVCHYGFKNAWRLSKELRILFRKAGKKEKLRLKEERKKGKEKKWHE